MRVLLDTNALLWINQGTLAPPSVAALKDSASIHVSAASIWEVEIKAANGKLKIDGDLIQAVHEAGFKPLAITLEHSRAAGRLPLHHRDPFDRMLIAQAAIEKLTIATADRQFESYQVPLIGVARA
ncbi:MAG: type II toxin-antitoxin system VapC family toxin [Solirubrobacterales bacterium]|nr:type II toxin-antitoxin system VapC family toxin [Solirubrobacterales bacterium]